MSELTQLKSVSKKLDLLSQENAVNDAKTQKDLEYLTREVAKLTKVVETKFITREEFEPVKRLVYGVVGLILTIAIVGLFSVYGPK